jgi:hypothetical protein
MKKIVIISFAAFLAACAAPQSGTYVPDAVIDDDFVRATLERNDAYTIPYRVGIFESDGNYVVCAAAANIKNQFQLDYLAALKITVNGQTLQRGLRWARAYSSPGDLNGKAAACRVTTVPVMENGELGIELTQSTFRR